MPMNEGEEHSPVRRAFERLDELVGQGMNEDRSRFERRGVDGRVIQKNNIPPCLSDMWIKTRYAVSSATTVLLSTTLACG